MVCNAFSPTPRNCDNFLDTDNSAAQPRKYISALLCFLFSLLSALLSSLHSLPFYPLSSLLFYPLFSLLFRSKPKSESTTEKIREEREERMEKIRDERE